jgi:hypothetical protein
LAALRFMQGGRLAQRLLTPEEFEAKCHDDALFFIESCLWIQPKEGGLVPFRLNDRQMDFYRAVRADWKAGEPIRYCIVKARRQGFSTLIEALLYWRSTTRKHTNSLVVAQDIPTSENILDIAHRFTNFDRRKDCGQMPEISRDNRGEIVFDTHWRERGGDQGLDSRFVVASADRKTGGRSYTLQNFHGSEVAHWTDSTLVTGIVDALSYKPETLGFLESTANGRNGYFYDTYKKAEKGRGMWKPWFCSWKTDPDCRIHLSPKQREVVGNMLSDAENRLGKEHDLDLEQLWFRRKKIEDYPHNSGRAPEDLFRQEYPLNPDEAFISTGRQYFDMNAAHWYSLRAAEATYTDGLIDATYPRPEDNPFGRARPVKIRFVPLRPLLGKPCFVRIWEQPQPECDYVIGADVAMGFSHGDFSVAYVLRRDTLSVVARIRGQIEPDRFADMIVDLAWFYNEAYLCPENNAIGMAVAKRTSHRYARHAYQMRLDTPNDPRVEEDKPGWHTSPLNRREMLGVLRMAVRDKAIRIWDEDFVAELSDFVVPTDNDGHMREDRPRAAEHKKDDGVMALAITLQANDVRLAGPIRRPKPKPEAESDWKRRALLENCANEGVEEPVADEHMGSYW